ncbi:hypothetical protein [[Bacillus] enclensis]|uniref:hypothetical protein n=1 Tax=[Bacillus] enclensis TaxID=1402860 RepID=UPI0018DC9D58|nr:hypothetical protein [[Bacillus] enclensis]MBH9968159.1 hypothetical protein [[Bacillus] enclensis]
MRENEKVLLHIMRNHNEWSEIFTFIVNLHLNDPRREKLLRDQYKGLIDYVSMLDEHVEE